MKPIVTNVLNDFASATYAFRLYVAPEKEYVPIVRSAGNRMTLTSLASSFSSIGILSETGVTPIQINNLMLNTRPESRGMTPTGITFDIVEPRNSTFIEQLVSSAVSLGWDSTIAAAVPLILEIRFLGRTKDNDIERDIQTISIPINIGSADVTIDNSSSTYSVKASVFGESFASTFMGQVIPETINVDAGNNLDDFFNNFAQALNDKEEQQVDNEVISLPKVIHSFNIPDEYKGYEVSKPTSGTQTSSNKTFEEYNATTNIVTFPNRLTIPAAIDIILKNVIEIEEDLLNGDGDTAYSYEIYPDQGYKEYDKISEKYQVDIVWNIRRRPMPMDNRGRPSNEAMKKNLAEAVDVFKVYDYYFTGENTEVKGINWTVNHLYSTKVSAYHSIITRNSNNRTTTGQHSHEPADEEIEQTSIEAARDDTWSVDTKTNELGENVFYSANLNIDGVDFIQPHPRTIRNLPNTDNSSTDIESNRRSHEYLNQLAHIRNMGSAGMANSFSQLELKIKGDPFWVTPRSPYPIAGATAENSQALMHNPAFLLRFYHPNDDYYKGVNFKEVKQYSAFTGIYNVTNIISTFNNGRFEQTLTGRRKAMVPSEVEKLIDEAKGT